MQTDSRRPLAGGFSPPGTAIDKGIVLDYYGFNFYSDRNLEVCHVCGHCENHG